MKIRLFILFALSALCISNLAFLPKTEQRFVCTPCGNECDKEVYSRAGSCIGCQMPLVDKATVTFANYTPEKVCGKLMDTSVIVLDVRTVEEFNGTTFQNYGRIRNAINIPIQELEKRIEELNAFRHKEVIVYCSHSKRSPRAAYMLSQKGFGKVSNMLGGASAWNSAGSCKKWIVK